MRWLHLHDAALWAVVALSAIFVIAVWTLAVLNVRDVTYLDAGLMTGLVLLINLRESRGRSRGGKAIRTAFQLGYQAGSRDWSRFNKESGRGTHRG